MVYHDLLALVYHLKRLDIDVVDTPIRERRGDAWQVEPHEELKPPVLSLVGGNPLRYEHFLVHPSLVDQIVYGVMPDAIDDPPLFQIVVDILLHDGISRNPRNVGERLVAVLLHGDDEFLLVQGVKYRFFGVLFLGAACSARLLAADERAPLLFHVRRRIDQAAVG